ncbi:serine/threonine-protein kinase [Ktedonospora formicarum]|uniref:non-specific serine/threonine protein kinase n=1 Tax=Ktedonospora formicarum TaxID=2778364 RepID=A0A8J3IB61_9CHLR|nr:serine/threonine-protein kinase [Ktedonospora formicarum]GHO49083.1 hypothetical protein KSX_72460 [Ktedonospora formicarum]
MTALQQCRICGSQIPSQSAFCPSCGASIEANAPFPTVTIAEGLPSTSPQPPITGTGRIPIGQMLHGRYRLLQAVGQGGMGAVYVAQDTQLGDRLVAVKEMSMSRLVPQEVPLAIEQFRHEAHLLASLHHQNLPEIYEHFSEHDRWYLVMSFIEGQNLQAALDTASGHKLPLKEVLHIGLELCDVLEYLHTHTPQIIFRDLKPLNIMLTPRGRICLIDFGIARHFKHEQTRDTAYYYSVGYAPPEQYGQSQTGPRSDIYSLGATLHQMFSGFNPASRPFQFPSLHLVDPTLPEPLVKLIAQMLEMNEQARPTSAAEVKTRLEQFSNQVSLPATVIVPPTPAPRNTSTPPQQTPAATTDETASSDLWDHIGSYLSQGTNRYWLGFIVLSFIFGCLLPLITWSNVRNYNLSDHAHTAWLASPFLISSTPVQWDFLPAYWTVIGAVGAVVIGLLLLLRKRRGARLDLLGGFILSVIASINFLLCEYGPFTHVSSLADVHYQNYDMLQYDPQYNNNFVVYLLLFSLWLFVGTRFFLRGSKRIGKMLFSIFLLIVSVLLLTPFEYAWRSSAIWLPALISIVCAIIALRASLRKPRPQSSIRP